MDKHKIKRSFSIVFIGILFYFLSFQWNEWLCSNMVLHQIVQLPAMIGLGIFLAFAFPKIRIVPLHWGISILIFIASSIVFWMLPHSIDYAVIHNWFNRIMHINMLICGFLIIAVFRGILFEIKIYFLGMVSAMLIASGITLRVFDILLCSSFNIQQQNQTGAFLILLGTILVIYTLITFFRKPLQSKSQMDQ